MIKDQIRVGKVYLAKVNNRLCRVRITAIRKRKGYAAINLESNRKITIRSAAKLQREINLALICGVVGEKAGSEFHAFLQISESLPSLEEIIQKEGA